MIYKVLLTERAFADLEGIKAFIALDNKASRRVLEKCGFALVYEGKGLYQGKTKKTLRMRIDLGAK